MRTITRLANGSLRRRDVAAPDDDRFQVTLYGGIVGDGGIRIGVIEISTSDTAHALGFDDWGNSGSIVHRPTPATSL